MAYEPLLKRNVIRPHELDQRQLRKRVEEMLILTQSHLTDAQASGLSVDAHHGFAYGVARVAAELVMLAEGFRPGRSGSNHVNVFIFLRHVAEGRWAVLARRFDRARKKRNVAEYERAGTVTETELAEMQQLAAAFLGEVSDWLAKHHPELVPDPPPSSEHP